MMQGRAGQFLLAIPVYNEAATVERVVSKVRGLCEHVLVVDDGSTDGTSMILQRLEVDVLRHCHNMGYGRTMRDIFAYAANAGFEWVIVMDCDEQHEPEEIPAFVEGCARNQADIISGSRYLDPALGGDAPPEERRRINAALTHEINLLLGLALTDSFCGFKAYRTSAVRKMLLDIDGYEFPLQFWVQAVALSLRIQEIPVRLIYNDPSRSFGGLLDDAAHRLEAYRRVMWREIETWRHALSSRGLLAMGGSECAGGA